MEKELEFIRKVVIMACHSDCTSYEEALEQDLGFGCLFCEKIESEPNLCYPAKIKMLDFLDCDEITGYFDEEITVYKLSEISIIGQPITLAKILIAISKIDSIYVEIDDYGHIFQSTAANVHSRKKVTQWDLTKDLDQQETSVILAIAKLLGYEKD